MLDPTIKKRRSCCNPKSKRFTDYLDLFAQPVYNFTFRDSYVVSTVPGSVCTILFMIMLVVVFFAKAILYIERDPSTFTVTKTLEYGYYSSSTAFDRHSIAFGLIYKAEYQD